MPILVLSGCENLAAKYDIAACCGNVRINILVCISFASLEFGRLKNLS